MLEDSTHVFPDPEVRNNQPYVTDSFQTSASPRNVPHQNIDPHPNSVFIIRWKRFVAFAFAVAVAAADVAVVDAVALVAAAVASVAVAGCGFACGCLL